MHDVSSSVPRARQDAFSLAICVRMQSRKRHVVAKTYICVLYGGRKVDPAEVSARGRALKQSQRSCQ
jgi:hypothetical protein